MRVMRKEYRTSTCGKKKHDPLCLCDVVVKEPVPIMADYGRNSFMSLRLIEVLGLSSPWDDASILKLLTNQVSLHDDVVEYKRRVEHRISTQQPEAGRKFTLGQGAAIAEMYEDGWNHNQVRTYVLEQWGIELDRVYAHRLQERARSRKRKYETPRK